MLVAVGAGRSRPDVKDTYAAALITQARNLAVAHRYVDAVGSLYTDEFRRYVATSSHPDLVLVLSELAWWMAWGGRLAEAERIFDEVETRLDRQAEEVTDQLRFSIRARHAYVVGVDGARASSERAVAMFTQLVSELEAEPEVTAELRFHIRRQRARWIGTTGHAERALGLLGELEDEFAGVIPADSEEWLLLLSNLAYFTASIEASNSGAAEEAEQRYASLVAARTMALGALHPHTLDARRNASWVLGRRDPTTALRQDIDLVADCLLVLDASHRYVVATRLDIAVLAARLDDPGVVNKQVDLVLAAVEAADSAFDVLSEYGSVDAPIGKLDELTRYLRSNADENRGSALTRARENLHGERP